MGTVAITGVAPDPEIFGANLAAAVNYVKAKYGATYTAWLELVADDQGRTLVSATDYLDRLALKDAGVAIAHSTAIVAVQNACFEMAVLIADDPDIVALLDAGSNIKAVDASGAGVEFFNPTSTRDGSASKVPYVVQQFVAAYMSGVTAATVIGGYGQAGNAPCDCDDLDRSEPF